MGIHRVVTFEHRSANPCPRRHAAATSAGACALLALAATLVTAPSAAAGNPTATVRPGGVVRWAGGEGVVRCSAGGESWEPLAGTCYYPVDLLRGDGAFTVSRRTAAGEETAQLRVGDYPYPEQRLTVDDRHVNLSPADLARANGEAEEVGKLWSLRTPRRFTLPLHPPLADLPEGGRFGARRVFNNVPKSPHTGADYAARTGTPVLAPAAGTVVLAADHFFAGKSVFIDHGDGLVSMLFHLSEIGVKRGDRVERGQPVGAVGASGRATGPHLHFGLRWRGARIDPAVLLGPPAAVPAI